MTTPFHRRLSLITVCYNRWFHLQNSLPTWLRQTYPNVEVVVVMGGDDDGPKELVSRDDFRGTVLRVRNAPNYRASYMRNIGAAAATGEILGFVDADVYLVPQWANHCVAQLQQRCDAVINSVTWSEADAGGCTGTCVLQRWLFERVNGFNENLDAAWGYEDTDLLVRLQRAGGRVGSYPVSMVRHINHGDDLRQCHFIGKRQARAPGTFMQHLDTCRRDAEVHCYEANRVRRLTFPTPEITQIVRSEEI